MPDSAPVTSAAETERMIAATGETLGATVAGIDLALPLTSAPVRRRS